jgi:hypothetical protein
MAAPTSVPAPTIGASGPRGIPQLDVNRHIPNNGTRCSFMEGIIGKSESPSERFLEQIDTKSDAVYGVNGIRAETQPRRNPATVVIVAM